MKTGLLKALRNLIIAVALAASVTATATACGSTGYYDGPAYVVGHYTCVNPHSGQLDYCVEYSDGSSSLVPWSIYSTVLYGSVLTLSHTVWSVHSSPYIRAGYIAPDVYHVHYHQARVYASVRSIPSHARVASSPYGGMSYRNKSGRVIYQSPSGRAYNSGSRVSSSFTGSSYRSSSRR